MRRIAHISDLHFGRTDPAVVEGLVDELNRAPPDLIIASGDFTMRARRREYAEARAFLARLSAPWVAVPGNHDIAHFKLFSRFFHPFRRYRNFIHAETEPTFLDDEIGSSVSTPCGPGPRRPTGRRARSPAPRSPAPRRGSRPCPGRSFPHRGRPPPVHAAALGRGGPPRRPGGRGARRLPPPRRRPDARRPSPPPLCALRRGARDRAEPDSEAVDRGTARAHGTRLLAVQAGSATSTRLRATSRTRTTASASRMGGRSSPCGSGPAPAGRMPRRPRPLRPHPENCCPCRLPRSGIQRRRGLHGGLRRARHLGLTGSGRWDG